MATFWFSIGGSEEAAEFFKCQFPVGMLRTRLLHGNLQNPILGDVMGKARQKPLLLIIGEERRADDIETENHLGFHLVDVLPARAARP